MNLHQNRSRFKFQILLVAKMQFGALKDLKNQIDRITKEENSFVIRLGRWSQFEFVTLYDENKKRGGTRTLFDYNGQYLPMGWCKCTISKL